MEVFKLIYFLSLLFKIQDGGCLIRNRKASHTVYVRQVYVGIPQDFLAVATVTSIQI
jgi:hypothetical protein